MLLNILNIHLQPIAQAYLLKIVDKSLELLQKAVPAAAETCSCANASYGIHYSSGSNSKNFAKLSNHLPESWIGNSRFLSSTSVAGKGYLPQLNQKATIILDLAEAHVSYIKSSPKLYHSSVPTPPHAACKPSSITTLLRCLVQPYFLMLFLVVDHTLKVPPQPLRDITVRQSDINNCLSTTTNYHTQR